MVCYYYGTILLLLFMIATVIVNGIVCAEEDKEAKTEKNKGEATTLNQTP